ncbi:hypothetical protein [Amycolatopsis lexingtonensis]|uniref:hypothetical protein n=1 Tax=Amycolatopsis lexingtonensis TaxID=218822 RepID=UPI003F72E615
MTLVLKLVLAPLLVVGSSLAGRRWGPGVTGLLVAMPVVVGPILLITYLDHGPAFVARAASASLLGLVSLAAFAVVFARVARVRGWLGTVVVGWLVCLALDLALSFAPVPVWAALGAALAAAWAGARLVPVAGVPESLRGIGGTDSVGPPAPGEGTLGSVRGVGEAAPARLPAPGEPGSLGVPAPGEPGPLGVPASAEAAPVRLHAPGEPNSLGLPAPGGGVPRSVRRTGETDSVSPPASSEGTLGSVRGISEAAPARLPASDEPGLLSLPALAEAGSLGRREAAPSSPGTTGPVNLPWWDLPARALATAGLVLALTATAGRLGPDLTGVLAPFPTGTSVVAAFALAQGGPPAAVATMRGVLRGLRGFAAFCFLVAVLAEPLGGWAFAIAVTGAATVQWASRGTQT